MNSARGFHTSSSAFMALLMTIFICNLLNCSPLTFASAQKPKILCLHGGGGNKNSMAGEVADIEKALPEYEFVYVNAAYGRSGSYLWIKDPPGGKDEPTTDPGWADESIQVLDDVVEAQGPFHGILGYSQGAAFVPVYLSRVPNDTFQMAITFCGYLTTTHLGLLGKVREMSPFGDIAHLVWMGRNDGIISNPMTKEMAAEFTEPTIVRSTRAGHIVPGSNDSTFDQVVSFIRDGSNPGPPSPPTTKPPTVKPPTVKPPTVKPPTVKPPTVKPPTVKPPTVKPPTVKPPTVKPPTVKPPTVKPPTVKPPTVKPPTVKPPTVKPPTECFDSVAKFKWVRNSVRNCKWAGKNGKCDGKQYIQMHCPSTCGKCETYECVDSPLKFFTNIKKKKTFTCEDLSKLPNAKVKKLCGKGKKYISTCRDTCALCMKGDDFHDK